MKKRRKEDERAREREEGMREGWRKKGKEGMSEGWTKRNREVGRGERWKKRSTR